MKRKITYFLLLITLMSFIPVVESTAGEINNTPPVESQTRVYVIHHERRAFVRRPMRRYLLHRKRVWRRHHLRGKAISPAGRPHRGPRR